jgi:four helix bundle protein
MDKFELQNRTKKFAANVIIFAEKLEYNRSLQILLKQVIRSATSVGANYRSACKGKSKADFIYKIVICEEEADESIYWFELMLETNLVDAKAVTPFIDEAKQLTAIFTAIGKSAKANK